jgi:hypothetical protein
MTGILRGGPLDGGLVEIEKGAETVECGPWLLAPTAEADPESPVIPLYRYVGELDAEGHAVYIAAE